MLPSPSALLSRCAQFDIQRDLEVGEAVYTPSLITPYKFDPDNFDIAEANNALQDWHLDAENSIVSKSRQGAKAAVDILRVSAPPQTEPADGRSDGSNDQQRNKDEECGQRETKGRTCGSTAMMVTVFYCFTDSCTKLRQYLATPSSSDEVNWFMHCHTNARKMH